MSDTDKLLRDWNDPCGARTMSDAEDLIESLQATITELTAENADSKREAESLAMALWRRHYREASPDFELCDSTAGVITQINNMSAGLNEKVEELIAELAMHRDIDRLVVKTIKRLDADEALKQEGEQWLA